MSEEEMSEETKEFIRKFIESVTQLEILLLVQKHPEKEWTAGEVSHRLFNNEASVESHMTRLFSRDLLTVRKDGQRNLYQFRSRPELEARVQDLAFAYRRWRTRVIELIFTRNRMGPME